MSPGNPAPQPEGPDNTNPSDTFAYTTHSGDTLAALSARFGVQPEQIHSTSALTSTGYLPIGTQTTIPNVLRITTPDNLLLPDSETINSPSSVGFAVGDFVEQAGGYLSTYQETVSGEDLSGADIIQRVASESSVNPRLLLAILEHRAGWVYGQPISNEAVNYPFGFAIPDRKGLYQETVMAATHLNIGYYGWRQGVLTDIRYSDGSTARLNPVINPGTAGIQNLIAKFNKPDPWHAALYGSNNLLQLYEQMFGDPWERAAQVEPLIPDGLSQPLLELPFAEGERWSLTGGPHFSWNTGSPRGALDFSPVTGEAICAVSRLWATAVSPGIIARASNNVVALDLDGDGNEQTGWVLVYVHLADNDLVTVGKPVVLDDPLGHPSCERGQSTGKHTHIARKYNGEWLPADDPLPFVMSGWRARTGQRNYEGTLEKGEMVVSANSAGARTSIVVR